jgi:hypothetical protein
VAVCGNKIINCEAAASANSSRISPESPLHDSPTVHDQCRRGYKDFKSSADIASRIEELKARERQAFEFFNDGAIARATLTIEIERNVIYRHLLMCLALVAGGKGTVPDLIVV